MVVAALIPRFPLLVALRAARMSLDGPVALGPQPGDPQVLGLCTPSAHAAGVRPGLRVGEALARCPRLQIVVAHPDAAADAAEAVTLRLEGLGAAVEVDDDAPGVWCTESRGLERLYGGTAGVLARVAHALPVGAGGQIGAAPTRFAAVQAALEAAPRHPLTVAAGDVATLLAPLPVGRLPLDVRALRALADAGIARMGDLAELPRAAVLERLGIGGVRAWRLARGEPDDPLRPRRPPQPLDARLAFPYPLGALHALEAAARLLLEEVVRLAHRRARAIRSLSLRAGLEGGGSWTRTVRLREATTDIDRLHAAALPWLAEIDAPVESLAIRADAGGTIAGRQLTVLPAPGDERRRRAREAVRHVSATHGSGAVTRLVEIEPYTRLPERRWALVPFDT